MKNTAHVDFKDKNAVYVRFVTINSRPAEGGQLTAKYYVDHCICNSVVESSLLGLDLDEEL